MPFFMASSLRKFALVLGYECVLQEFRILVFHHGGLTSSSKALKLDDEGKEDLLRIFLVIFPGRQSSMLVFPYGVTTVTWFPR